MWTTIKNQLDSKIFSLVFGYMETLEYYPLRMKATHISLSLKKPFLDFKFYI